MQEKQSLCKKFERMWNFRTSKNHKFLPREAYFWKFQTFGNKNAQIRDLRSFLKTLRSQKCKSFSHDCERVILRKNFKSYFSWPGAICVRNIGWHFFNHKLWLHLKILCLKYLVSQFLIVEKFVVNSNRVQQIERPKYLVVQFQWDIYSAAIYIFEMKIFVKVFVYRRYHYMRLSLWLRIFRGRHKSRHPS